MLRVFCAISPTLSPNILQLGISALKWHGKSSVDGWHVP